MRRTLRLCASLVISSFLAGCGGAPGAPVEIVVPSGATLTQVADTLLSRGVISAKLPFVLFARMRGDDHNIRSGRYLLPTNSSWRGALDPLTRGSVVTVPMTIPEGFTLRQMVERIGEVTARGQEEVSDMLAAPDLDQRFGVPGPGLEGYLFPDTYRFARGVPVQEVLAAMTYRYRSVWTPERRARLDSLGMTEREVVTLASIVQAEARKVEEMPKIASVYHNRLKQGWLLQADPTVLFALGGPRARLLYAAIDSVQDNPYNTYTQKGLPPGPIGAPGEAALVATLFPAEERFMYFVATPDGAHVFTRTLAEHNLAKAAARRAWDELGARQAKAADREGR